MARFTSGARSLTQGERYMMHYNSARGNMLLAIIFTVVNSLLACIGGNMYFLFSITFPYAMVSEGAFWTGLMGTPEQYAEYGYTEADMMPMWFLAVMIVPALVALGVYLLCWIFSKKHVGWMIAATVAFVLDTLFLIVWYGVDVTMLLDYLFHGWALFLFIRGCIAHFKLKELERENAAAENVFVPATDQGTVISATFTETADDTAAPAENVTAAQAEDGQAQPDSPVLHAADFGVKSRVLLEYKEQAYDICYRRVGKVNELVINGMVYDLLETGLVEPPHELCAYLDGHEIAAGTGADSYAFIRFDGEVLKRKLRLT